jgi:hypothetical protein
VAAFSLDKALREAIYNVVPVTITAVPHLPHEADQWGMVMMKQKKRHGKGARPVFAATGLTPGGSAVYRDALHQICS